jgi:hypothetical protein
LNILLQRPYLVKGGFQAWSKNLRVKELKPETALTAINEVKRIRTRNSPVKQKDRASQGNLVVPQIMFLFSFKIIFGTIYHSDISFK